jgi:circadian clock protein KaiC
MKHVVTGVNGHDKMTDGGFMHGSSVLLSGSSGTGKTVIGTQFIVNSLLKNEPGIIVSLKKMRYRYGKILGSPVKAPSDAFMEAFRK